MSAGGSILGIAGCRTRVERQETGGRSPMSTRKLLESMKPGTIATLAGVGWREGTEAASTDAGWPVGVVRNAKGELIVVDYHGHRVFRIDRAGIVHRFAGDGVPGFRGDGGPALDARFNSPHDLWQDRHGNLFVSDLLNYRIRRIDAATGVITTIAGCGRRGRGGDGGPATAAELDITCGIATDRAGNLYLSDELACTVRRVDARTGIISRFAGIGVGGYNGDGIPALEAALYHPEHLAFDSRDQLYICDNSNDRIRRVDGRGILTTVLGNPFSAGVDGQHSRSSSGDGGPAVEATIIMPDSLFVDGRNDIYVGEKYGFRIRHVDARTGIVRTVVGTGVPGFGADGEVGERSQINACEVGLWVDPDGSVLWTDCSGRLRRVDPRTRIVTTLFGGTSVGDGGPASAAFLTGPAGIAVAGDGTIYFADTWNQRVRAIAPDGTIRTVAGTGVRHYGGDGGPATEAYLGNPASVAVDAAGNLYIADPRHSHIRRVDRSGTITAYVGNGFPRDRGDGGSRLNAEITAPRTVAIGPDGALFLGDVVGRIRRVDAATGRIETVVGTGIPGYRGDGGPATQARITQPAAIAFDREGNLLFVDSGSHCVRLVDRAGKITTVAGSGEAGFSADGTPATRARLASPSGVAVDARGRIYIAEAGNHRIRRVERDGALATIAGSGEAGDAGDGGPALSCCFNELAAIALIEPDGLLVSDHFNSRLRIVKLDRG